ncbi:hypothetical protein PybrP1_005705 [[Pythium] brassicae (nom. inval.)]|nr:hypothetical protein PybrP1_005705 [[Pythium] brassicae (nom. inval.)]
MADAALMPTTPNASGTYSSRASPAIHFKLDCDLATASALLGLAGVALPPPAGSLAFCIRYDLGGSMSERERERETEGELPLVRGLLLLLAAASLRPAKWPNAECAAEDTTASKLQK